MPFDLTAPPSRVWQEPAAEVSQATGGGYASGPALPETAQSMMESRTTEAQAGAWYSRDAERDLVKRTLVPEQDSLAAQHSALVQKQFGAGLDADERRELAIIRWKLDRIDDAVEGAHLDLLEQLVERQVELAQSVAQFESALRTRMPEVVRPRRSR